MSFYSQTDPRWKNILLGYNTEQPWNIGNYGCVCTSWANMLVAITGDQGYTPAMINAWMEGHQGFLPGGGIFIWGVALGMGHVEYVKDTTDINEVNVWVKDPPNYAVVSYNKGGHYCLSNISGQIVDSEDGKVKGIGAYPFTSAKLYRSIEPGHGNITTSTTSAGGDTVAMTADEELRAYQIVLGRGPDHAMPDGRIAMQFILDSASELEQARANNTAQVASLNQQISNLTAKLVQVPAVAQPDELDFILTMQDDDRPRVAASDGVSIDFTGENPDKPFVAGTVFHQAEVYVVNNTIMIRTYTSVDGDTWYLTDQMYFDDEPATIPTSSAHANASMAVGIVSRFVNNIMSLFKKGPSK